MNSPKDGVLVLPTDSDAQWCLKCGQDALDTGWECTSCGYDNMPWYYPTLTVEAPNDGR